MVGIFEADSKIIKKPAGHGYTILKPNNENKKKVWFSQFDIIRGHEFHHAKLMQHGNNDFAFKIVRGYGVDGSYDGLIYKNVLVSFTHIFAPGVYRWFETWLNTIKCSKMQSKNLKNIDFIHS